MNERIKQLAEQAQQYAEYTTPQGLEWLPAFKEKFAELIRADEREACAKVCDDEASTWTAWPQAKAALTVGAIAIRARGNT